MLRVEHRNPQKASGIPEKETRKAIQSCKIFPVSRSKPENKDLSSESGSKKKNVNIVMTDADAPKRLLRQKIFDQFDYQNWSSVPVQRGQVFKDSQPTKKLIIDPIGGEISQLAISVAAPKCRHILVGNSGGVKVEIKASNIIGNEHEFVGFNLLMQPLDLLKLHFLKSCEDIRMGKIKVKIGI